MLLMRLLMVVEQVHRAASDGLNSALAGPPLLFYSISWKVCQIIIPSHFWRFFASDTYEIHETGGGGHARVGPSVCMRCALTMCGVECIFVRDISLRVCLCVCLMTEALPGPYRTCPFHMHQASSSDTPSPWTLTASKLEAQARPRKIYH